MTIKELETRVAALEQEVRRLNETIGTKVSGNGKDWRAAVEKYAGNEGLLSVFAEAQKLREKDRERARKRAAKDRKSRS